MSAPRETQLDLRFDSMSAHVLDTKLSIGKLRVYMDRVCFLEAHQ